MQPETCGRELWHNWTKELLYRPERPSLLRVLAWTYGRPYAWLGLLKLLNDLLAFSGPLLLKLLVTWLTSAHGQPSAPPLPAAQLLAPTLELPLGPGTAPKRSAMADLGGDAAGGAAAADGSDGLHGALAGVMGLVAASVGPGSAGFGWVCVALLGLSSGARALLNAHFNYQLSRLSCQLRAGLVCVLYRKSLLAMCHCAAPATPAGSARDSSSKAADSVREAGNAVADGGVGANAGDGSGGDGPRSGSGPGCGISSGDEGGGGEDVSTLMSVDAGRAVNLLLSFHELWSLPWQMVLALYLLYMQVRYAFLAGLAVSLLLVPANRVIAAAILKASAGMMAAKDARVAAMSELLRGIRAVKTEPQWQHFYVAKVAAARRLELRGLAIRKYLDALCVYFWAATSLLFSALTFGLVVLLNGSEALTPAVAFTSLSLFQLLTGPLNAFPWVLNGVVEAIVSLRRLQRYLLRPETKALWAYEDLQLSLRDLPRASAAVVLSQAATAAGAATGCGVIAALQDTLAAPEFRTSASGGGRGRGAGTGGDSGAASPLDRLLAVLRLPPAAAAALTWRRRARAAARQRHSAGRPGTSVWFPDDPDRSPADAAAGQVDGGAVTVPAALAAVGAASASGAGDTEAGRGVESAGQARPPAPQPPQLPRPRPPAPAPPQGAGEPQHEEPECAAASFCNATFSWRQTARPCLYDICLSVPRGTLTVVVGRVGSGKSSLLAALLGGGELPLLRGSCRTFVRRWAYAPQQPWVTAGTLRENILLGLPLRQGIYRRVLHDCALLPDLAALPKRDLTPVGDHGCDLSGGQRARLGLARALYHAACGGYGPEHAAANAQQPRLRLPGAPREAAQGPIDYSPGASPLDPNSDWVLNGTTDPWEPYLDPDQDVLVLLDDVLASLDRCSAAHVVRHALLGPQLLPNGPGSALDPDPVHASGPRPDPAATPNNHGDPHSDPNDRVQSGDEGFGAKGSCGAGERSSACRPPTRNGPRRCPTVVLASNDLRCIRAANLVVALESGRVNFVGGPASYLASEFCLHRRHGHQNLQHHHARDRVQDTGNALEGIVGKQGAGTESEAGVGTQGSETGGRGPNLLGHGDRFTDDAQPGDTRSDESANDSSSGIRRALGSSGNIEGSGDDKRVHGLGTDAGADAGAGAGGSTEPSEGRSLQPGYDLDADGEEDRNDESGAAADPAAARSGTAKATATGAGTATETEAEVEQREVGHVRWGVYRRYLVAVGGGIVLVVLFSLLLMQASRNAIDLWVSAFAAQSGPTAAAPPAGGAAAARPGFSLAPAEHPYSASAVAGAAAMTATAARTRTEAAGLAGGPSLSDALTAVVAARTSGNLDSDWAAAPRRLLLGALKTQDGSSLRRSLRQGPAPQPTPEDPGAWQVVLAPVRPAAWHWCVLVGSAAVGAPQGAAGLTAATAGAGAGWMPAAAAVCASSGSSPQAGAGADAGAECGSGMSRNASTAAVVGTGTVALGATRHIRRDTIGGGDSDCSGSESSGVFQSAKDGGDGAPGAARRDANHPQHQHKYRKHRVAAGLEWSPRVFLTGVAVIAVANSVFTMARAFSFALAGMRAARLLHEQLLAAVLAAPMAFFDSVPHGRILNRFSSDLSTVDDSLPFILNIALANAASLLGLLAVLAYAAPPLLPMLLPLAFVYRRIQLYYRSSSREIRRLEALALSPVYAAFGGLAEWAHVIRAFACQRHFLAGAVRAVTKHQRATITGGAASAWLGLRLQLLASVLVTAVAGLAVWRHRDATAAAAADNPDGAHCGPAAVGGGLGAGPHSSAGWVASLAGLSLAYALPVVGLLNGLLTSTAETEQEMVAVERVGQYADLAPEPVTLLPHSDAAAAATEARPAVDGPEAAVPEPSALQAADGPDVVIRFDCVVVRYRPELPPALDALSLTVRAGEHVGLVGRTGAGKSSVVATLLRLAEVEAGRVYLYGKDIRAVPLPTLRSSVGVLPQSPFVASASLRENLNPGSSPNTSTASAGPAGSHAGTHTAASAAAACTTLSDAALCSALRRVGLWDTLVAAALHHREDTRQNGATGRSAAAPQAAAFRGACAAAAVSEAEVLGLPLGSLPGAAGLSAGQQQLLCLARLLLRRRRLILLDECSAHVDPATAATIRRLVSQELLGRDLPPGAASGSQVAPAAVGGVASRAVGPGVAVPGTDALGQHPLRDPADQDHGPCAVLEVAHDLTAVGGCDRVLVLEAGRAVEEGRPADLMRVPGGQFQALANAAAQGVHGVGL